MHLGASFGAAGVASTVAYVVRYAWRRKAVPADVGNAIAR
jgi:hypothetical protein